MIKLLLFIPVILTHFAFAEDDHCVYFKYCGSGSQGSSRSLPSSSTSANFNPSNISNVKGLGVETLLQPNNSLGFNLVTGNGKVGGAVISPTAENSFFGNRSIEIDEVYLQRRIDSKRYKNKKLNIALGGKIINQKDYGLDLGVSLKRNPDVKRINPGIGISARLGFLNLGAYLYTDDTKITFDEYRNPYNGLPYQVQYDAPTYQETFSVQTFSVGTKIKDLSLDWGMIRAKYDFYPEDTIINIYSAAYSHKNFLFNFAYRKEQSSNLKDERLGLVMERNKYDFYTGVQYFINRHVIIGASYNHFLLNELSATITLYL